MLQWLSGYIFKTAKKCKEKKLTILLLYLKAMQYNKRKLKDTFLFFADMGLILRPYALFQLE